MSEPAFLCRSIPASSVTTSLRSGLGLADHVDVYTLAETLTGVGDALRAINDLVNPGVDFEIYLDSLGPGGSVLTKFVTKKRVAKLTGVIVSQIILGLLVSYLYDKLKTHQKPVVTINADRVIIETEGQTTIIPKDVFEQQQKVSQSPEVAAGILRAFEALEEDHSVESLSVLPPRPEAPPSIVIPRREFEPLVTELEKQIFQSDLLTADEAIPPDTPTRRIQPHRTQLVIVKAVFERAKRKWQFYWNGVKISASITDQTFFDKLESRDIALRQGDALDVDLLVTQTYSPLLNTWENVLYQVVRVHAVIPGAQQTRIDFD
jgi:hypothetical protein